MYPLNSIYTSKTQNKKSNWNCYTPNNHWDATAVWNSGTVAWTTLLYLKLESNIEHSWLSLIMDTELDIIEWTSGQETFEYDTIDGHSRGVAMERHQLFSLFWDCAEYSLFWNLVNKWYLNKTMFFNIKLYYSSCRPFLVGYYNILICIPFNHYRVDSKKGSHLSKMYAKLQTLRYSLEDNILPCMNKVRHIKNTVRLL